MAVDIDEILGIDWLDDDQRLAIEMMESQSHLIDFLVGCRNKLNLSQQELGERMNITQSAVARIESGDRDPRLSTLRRLAAALGVRITFHAELAEPNGSAESIEDARINALMRHARLGGDDVHNYRAHSGSAALAQATRLTRTETALREEPK